VLQEKHLCDLLSLLITLVFILLSSFKIYINLFSNLARDTAALSPTIDVESSQLRFLGNLTLNLWDCGAQDAFVDNYLNNQREHIFSNVSVLIFVFDVESRDVQKDIQYFSAAMKAMQQYSSSARVFCLIHKMDLVPEEAGERVRNNRIF